jgi:hypothetical protein
MLPLNGYLGYQLLLGVQKGEIQPCPKPLYPASVTADIGIHFEHLDMGRPNQMIQRGVDAG